MAASSIEIKEVMEKDGKIVNVTISHATEEGVGICRTGGCYVGREKWRMRRRRRGCNDHITMRPSAIVETPFANTKNILLIMLYLYLIEYS